MKTYNNLLEVSLEFFKGIYNEDYIRRNITSQTSKLRRAINKFIEDGFIVKDEYLHIYYIKKRYNLNGEENE